MNKLIIHLFLFLSTVSSVGASLNPVDGSNLFTSSTYSGLRISPDGKLISAIYRDDKKQSISLIDVEEKTIAKEIDLGLDSRLLDYYWLNSSQLYLVGKYENFSAILIGTILDEKVDLKLSNAKGYLVDVLLDRPNEVLFAKRNHGNTNDLYIIKIADLIENNFDNAIEIEHNDRDVTRYFHDKLSDKIITSSYDNDSRKLTIKTIPKFGGNWKIILTREVDDIEFTVVAILDANYLAVLTNEQTDKVVLQRYNISTQKLEDVIYQHPKYDLQSASYNSSGELSYVKYEELGLRTAEYFNPVSKQINQRLSKTFEGLEYFSVDTDANSTKSILKVRGSNLPGEYLVYDHKKLELTRLLLSHPELEKRKLHKSKAFTVRAKDGTEIEAFLTSPDEKNSLSTLLVMPHGGPIDVKDNDRFNPEVQYFVTRGFSILRVNFRGSDGFGKDFQERGVGEFGQLIEEDITTVVNKVIRENEYENVCSIGSSYGGYSAVMLAIKHPNLYKCVVGGFGVYDLPLIFNHDNHVLKEKNRKKWESVVGKYSPELKQISPVYFAEKLKAPILLTAGREDETAVFEHTFRLAYILKKLNHPVETLYYENTGHSHNSYIGFRHEAAITYDFLIRTLNLEYPTSEKLDAKARAALAEDFSLIADKYNFDDWVKEDKEKAFQFYKIASEYGEPRSSFNIGAHYHRGELVEYDLKKAVEYYQRAASLDFASAHRRLGRMYMEGEHFDIDWSSAKKHLEKAVNLDDTAKNYLTLARFDCTAPGELRNTRRCLNILNLWRFEKRSKVSYKQAVSTLREVAPWIIAETNFAAEERTEFEEILNKALGLTEMDAELEDYRVGSFEYIEGIGYGNEDEYRNLSVGEVIEKSENEDHYFGVIFDVDVPGADRSYDKVGVAGRWTKNMTNGRKNYLSATVLYGSPKGEWRMLKEFKELNGVESVTLEIFDLRGNPLLTRTFKLITNI